MISELKQLRKIYGDMLFHFYFYLKVAESDYKMKLGFSQNIYSRLISPR